MPDSSNLLLIAILAVTGGLIGLLTRRKVTRGVHLRPDDTTGSHRARWWIPVVTGVGAALLGWRFGVERWPLLLPTLPVAWFGPWLSAIDVDVRRLPNRIVALHALVVAAGIAAAAILTATPALALNGTLAATVAFAVFWLLDQFKPGGIGWGDIKYSVVLAAATAAIAPSIAWWAFMIGSLAAVAATPFRATRSFPYGPWLFGGALTALTLFA